MDRDIFFSRSYEIPSYDNVIINGLSLSLTLSEDSKEVVIDELQEICNIWGATFKVLE